MSRAFDDGLARLLRAAVTARAAAAASGPALPRAGDARSALLQRAFAERGYYLRGGEKRTLHVDSKTAVWGGTGDGRQHASHKDDDKPRAILYETMSRTGDEFDALRGKLQAVTATSLWDTGLSVVLNMAYTPEQMFEDRGTPTKRKRTKGVSLAEAKDKLEKEYQRVINEPGPPQPQPARQGPTPRQAQTPKQGAQTAKGAQSAKRQAATKPTPTTRAWTGPPMNIVIAAWERRQRDVNDELEVVQASVPYTTLRVIAATSPGAAALDAALRTNHAQVWHKMGDSDMPILDPNPSNPTDELKTLGLVEEEATGNVLVTFGYNLTSAAAQGPVGDALRHIYKMEMELRDQIAALDEHPPMYPSEPTTFYRPIKAGAMTPAWDVTEKQGTGGSGQQLEGAKLAKALGETSGHKHFTFHSIMVDTSAGARNDRIVTLLNKWWSNGSGDRDLVDPGSVEQEIQRLDQSALRDGEYLDKVLSNLGYSVSGTLASEIQALVTKYRRRAAQEACEVVQAQLPARKVTV